MEEETTVFDRLNAMFDVPPNNWCKVSGTGSNIALTNDWFAKAFKPFMDQFASEAIGTEYTKSYCVATNDGQGIVTVTTIFKDLTPEQSALLVQRDSKNITQQI